MRESRARITALPHVALAPTSARAVRDAIAWLSPISDGSVNDLDRLSEDLDIGPLERQRMVALVEARLGREVDSRVFLHAVTVADLMTALQ